MKEPFGVGWGNYSLKGIVEIDLPQAYSLMPVTFGWVFLLVIFCLYSLNKISIYIKYYWRNRYRKQALRLLSKLKSRYDRGDYSAARELPKLLKETALMAYPRNAVADLFGDDFLIFMKSTIRNPDDLALQSNILYTCSYAPPQKIKALLHEDTWDSVRFWIESHLDRVSHSND